MKKKVLIITVLTLSFFCLVIYFGWIYGRMTFIWNSDTPSKYISKTVRNSGAYKADKEKLLAKFAELLKKRKDFFYNTSYSDSTTQIIIDTILYSPDFSKLAVLIIAKNPTWKQLLPNKNEEWFFDSTSYLAIRKDTTFELEMMGTTFTNADNIESASKYNRDYCFRHFIVKGSDIYKFNLDDIRFWDSKIWASYF